MTPIKRTTIEDHELEQEIRGDIREAIQPFQSLLDLIDEGKNPEAIKEHVTLCRDVIKELCNYKLRLSQKND